MDLKTPDSFFICDGLWKLQQVRF